MESELKISIRCAVEALSSMQLLCELYMVYNVPRLVMSKYQSSRLSSNRIILSMLIALNIPSKFRLKWSLLCGITDISVDNKKSMLRELGLAHK